MGTLLLTAHGDIIKNAQQPALSLTVVNTLVVRWNWFVSCPVQAKREIWQVEPPQPSLPGRAMAIGNSCWQVDKTRWTYVSRQTVMSGKSKQKKERRGHNSENNGEEAELN